MTGCLADGGVNLVLKGVGKFQSLIICDAANRQHSSLCPYS